MGTGEAVQEAVDRVRKIISIAFASSSFLQINFIKKITPGRKSTTYQVKEIYKVQSYSHTQLNNNGCLQFLDSSLASIIFRWMWPCSHVPIERKIANRKVGWQSTWE